MKKAYMGYCKKNLLSPRLKLMAQGMAQHSNVQSMCDTTQLSMHPQ